MSDESPIKVHPQAAGAQGGNRDNRDMGRTTGDSARIHLAADAHVMPLRMVLQLVALQTLHRLPALSRG